MDLFSLLNTAANAAKNEDRATDRTRQPNQSPMIATCDMNNETPLSPIHALPARRLTAETLGESNLPSHYRTPWSANGYTMPSVESDAVRSPVAPSFQALVESAGPRSPKHKFSDSHSSIASYMSYSASSSHSRFSSTSTSGIGQLPRPRLPSRTGVAPFESDLGYSTSGQLQPWQSTESRTSPPSITDEEVPTRKTEELEAVSATDLPATDAHGSALRPAATAQSHLSFAQGASPFATRRSAIPSGRDCMFEPNCETGSTPRKIISHIFGRNKSCTLAIPDTIWVHYCRKHYQRCRYRNPHEYAKIQCGLILEQIRRIDDWSNENKEKGQSKVVQDWTLSMRKREQNRVRDNQKKRSYSEKSNEADSDAGFYDNGQIAGDHALLNGTAVPQWLRDRCRSGYSTEEIRAIVRQLGEEVEKSKLTTIPDIEILPNILGDSTEEVKPRTLNKRQASAQNPLKRSGPATTGAMGLHPDWLSPDKRQRARGAERRLSRSPSFEYGTINDSNYPAEALAYRPRPNWSSIDNGRRAEEFYGSSNVGGPRGTYGGSALLTPTPPDTPAPGPSRPMHQRSVSDFPGYLQQAQPRYVPDGPLPQPNLFPNNAASVIPGETSYYAVPDWNLAPSRQLSQEIPDYYRRAPERRRHSRHQSTPNAALPAPTSRYGYVPRQVGPQGSHLAYPRPEPQPSFSGFAQYGQMYPNTSHNQPSYAPREPRHPTPRHPTPPPPPDFDFVQKGRQSDSRM